MPSSNNGPNPRRAPQRGIDLSSAYAKLGSDHRTGGSTHYRDPDVLERHPIPRGGELRLEALRPYGGGEPIIRWVAEYECDGAHNTIESYLQIPHHGFDVLEQPDAARFIESERRRVIAKVRRERLAAREL